MTQMYKLTVEELCSKLRPVFGKKMDDMYLRYAMAESRDEKEEIAGILNALYHKNLNKLLSNQVLLEPPLKENVDGDYPLGVVSYAKKQLHTFSLREQDWMRHVCVSGMSGSGKTNFAFHIINNFIKKDKPFLIFDWKKSFRPLMLADSEMMCFTIGNADVSNLFKVNINKPPKGIDPKEWINVLCDLITESFSASYGVHKVLLETLDEAFKEHGIYNGSNDYPSWNYIKWKLECKLDKTKGREAAWLESALRVAHVLTFGNFGKVLNYKGKESISFDELLDKKVILELNSLGNVEKKFFCEFLLTYVYKLKKANYSSVDEGFKHAILVDEAHNIFLKDKTNFVKESVTDMIYREMREYGTSLICLDQHISKLSDCVKGNSACHVVFQQQLPQDIWDISGLTQLSDKKEFFSMLPVGSAIVKLAERHTSPFLIEVPKAELRSNSFTDGDVKQRMSFIFDGRKVEAGVDRNFSDAVINGGVQEKEISGQEISEQENWPEKKEEVRIPNHALYNGQIKKPKIEEPVEEVFEQPKNEPGLNSVKEVLYDFVKQRLDAGDSLNEIEKIMEGYVHEGKFSFKDIAEVIDSVLKNNFNVGVINPENVTTEEKQNVYKEVQPSFEHSENKLSEEQKKLLIFLQASPNHNLSTVEVYNSVGLSARKGNKIKKELMEKGLIKIKEEKNEKGWKKIMRAV